MSIDVDDQRIWNVGCGLLSQACGCARKRQRCDSENRNPSPHSPMPLPAPIHCQQGTRHFSKSISELPGAAGENAYLPGHRRMGSSNNGMVSVPCLMRGHPTVPQLLKLLADQSLGSRHSSRTIGPAVQIGTTNNTSNFWNDQLEISKVIRFFYLTGRHLY